MKRLLFMLVTAIALISCGREILEQSLSYQSESTGIVLSQDEASPEYLYADHFVSKDKVGDILRKSFLGRDPIQVTSIYKDDDVVMYLALFEEGWALVAADDRAENHILAYDEEGSFNPDEIANPEFRFWFETTKSQMAVLRHTEDIKRIGKFKTLTKSGEEDYYWIRWHIRDDTTRVQDHVAHLLNTKWGQDEPWNIRCPFIDGNSGDRRLTGCVAVATAQILYYLKMSKGFPIGLYHQLTASFLDGYENVYSYYWEYLYSIPYKYISSISRSDYNNPSTRWAAMAKEADEEITTYVGDLMIDVGEYVNMRYCYRSANPYIFVSETDSLNVGDAYPYYGIDYDKTAYNYQTVKSSIDNGYPVMVYAYGSQSGNNYSGGHAWVIDGYHHYTTSIDRVYMWYRASADSLSYYEYDHCLTEAEMQSFFPNVNEGDIEHEYSNGISKYLLMNWGWDGEDNNVKCWFTGSEWPTTNNDYPYNPVILFNFREDE